MDGVAVLATTVSMRPESPHCFPYLSCIVPCVRIIAALLFKTDAGKGIAAITGYGTIDPTCLFNGKYVADM